MNRFPKRRKPAFFNPDRLIQLDAPLIQILGWLRVEPETDEGVSLAEGVWLR